jgi:CheY-like chemotaxis protein
MRKLVLVVAQETALRAKIARLLQPAGYAVELAASEKRALELIVSEHIDAAIVMPGAGLAGLAFTRRLNGPTALQDLAARFRASISILRSHWTSSSFSIVSPR